jgi:ribosomal subunit interface protein
MDIVVTSRNTQLTDRFRAVVADKLPKVGKHDPKCDRIDVVVTEEHNPRLADVRIRVELTCRTRGPVVRAEAAAGDEHAAFDLAIRKLDNRLRRSADRRRVHYGTRTPVSVAAATSALPDEPQPETAGDDGEAAAPYVVRQKEHRAAPMTLEQALFEMELVGHDFYLFVDEADATPCVVYRRKGYDYGVVRLKADTPGR